MGRYIRKRLLQAVPVVFGITILTFFIMKMAPGGPLTGMISPRTSSESLQRAREALGLNDPIIVQYWNWLKQLVQGNFGYSTYNGQAVLTEILDRLPATLLLTVTSFVISFVVGIPALVMSLSNLATVMRFARSSMIETLNQDYVRTARAKGLSEKVVIYKHALKNSMIPVITIFGQSIPNLFGGAYITEKVFGWPGMGLLGVDAINNRDYQMLMGLTLFTAILVLLGNLLADIMYSFVDPRIRY